MIDASTAFSAAPVAADDASSSGSSASSRDHLVGELGLLLEVRQLLVVELVAAVGDRLQLVHQGLRLARRDHRPQLRLQPGALGGRGRRRRAPARRSTAPAPRRGDAASVRRSRFACRRCVGRRSPPPAPGSWPPPVGQLVGGRVDALELQQVVGQHRMTVLDSGVDGIGARGSRTSGGTVVPLSTGTSRVTRGAVIA